MEKLKALQWQRLEETVRWALEKSPFYRERFEAVGLDLGKPLTLAEFQKIPVTEKADLIAENDRVHAKAEFKKLFFCETSGTSGQVLTFKRDEYWDSFNRASIFRGYSWHGVKPEDFNLYFWGYNISARKRWKVRMMDRLVNRYRVFDYSEEALAGLQEKIGKATYIEGYSSMIYELAKQLEDKNPDVRKLKMVKATSEKIYPHYHDVVKRVFGVPITSEYGAAESGIIAFSCPSGNMHLNMEGVYVETEADGSILVTNLVARSFPIIRYRLGDVVKMAPEDFQCPCGMAHPVVEEVTGRVGKRIVGRDKNFPSLVLYYIFKNLYFDQNLKLNYQGRQTEPGKLEIAIRENPEENVKKRLYAECEKYFGHSLELTFSFGAELRTEKGKLRDFITTLPE